MRDHLTHIQTIHLNAIHDLVDTKIWLHSKTHGWLDLNTFRKHGQIMFIQLCIAWMVYIPKSIHKNSNLRKKKMLFILNSIIPNTVVTKLWWWWWWCKFNHVSLSIKNTKKSEAQAQPQKGQHRHAHHVNSSINSKSVVPVALRSGSLEFPFWDWLSIERPAPPQWFSMSPSWDARIDSRKGEAKQ